MTVTVSGKCPKCNREYINVSVKEGAVTVTCKYCGFTQSAPDSKAIWEGSALDLKRIEDNGGKMDG